MNDKEKLQAIRQVIESLKEDDADYVAVEAALKDIEHILDNADNGSWYLTLNQHDIEALYNAIRPLICEILE